MEIKLHVNYNSKSENKIGYFKIEILKAYLPFILIINKNYHVLTSAMNLIKLLTAESQKNNKIYNLIENFYIIIKNKNWLKKIYFLGIRII